MTTTADNRQTGVGRYTYCQNYVACPQYVKTADLTDIVTPTEI
jgi:hypothetical protein